MLPGKYNLSVPGNGTFLLSLTYKDSTGAVVDLTTYTAKMRAIDSSNNTVLNLANGTGITLSATSPNIVVTVTVTVMETLVCSNGQYDLVIVSPAGKQDPLLAGGFVVVPGVTP